MGFKQDKNYYKILGFTEDGKNSINLPPTLEEIIRKRDVLKYINKFNNEQSELVEEAFEVLANSNSRKEYDLFLKEGITKSKSLRLSYFAYKSKRIPTKIKLSQGYLNSEIRFETEESKQIEKYNQTLERKIYNQINKRLDSYKLNQLALKYVNQLELIRSIMDVRDNQRSNQSGLTLEKAQKIALLQQFKRGCEQNKIIEAKIKSNVKQEGTFSL